MKFPSIPQWTYMLSPIQDKYNWYRPTEKDPNMINLANEDSSIKRIIKECWL